MMLTIVKYNIQNIIFSILYFLSFASSGYSGHLNKIYFFLAIIIILRKINTSIIVPKLVFRFWAPFFIMALIQILLINNSVNFKGVINLAGFFIISIGIIIFLYNNKNIENFIITIKWTSITILLLSIFYILTLSIYYNILKFDGNDLYGAISSIFPDGLVEKQGFSCILAMGTIFLITEKFKSKPMALLKYPLALASIYILIPGRSIAIGLIIAMFFYTVSKRLQLKYMVFLVTSLLLLLFILISNNEFDFIGTYDIRYGIYRGLSIVALEHPFLGVGLFNVGQFLGDNNNYYLSETGLIFDQIINNNIKFENFIIDTFPLNTESSFFGFLAEAGFIFTLYIYINTFSIIILTFHVFNKNIRYYALFVMALLFSSLTEDNLYQTYFIFSLFILMSAASLHKYNYHIGRNY